ncbi:hypothetical protein EB20_02543 [Enterococcus hirae]|nr:hypothetical protein EB20_02543 [Enterococcus hirae]RBT46957.1 hypothetical protein EB10_02768 [Enterococcus hirae]RBT51624.1 hypothetical protein EB24_02767 [Enterococcus hirae]RBT57871.1 hypothetical protein EB39_02768 [Enterococcus hirae]
MFLFSGGCPSAYIKQSLSIHSISGNGRKPVKKIPASIAVLLTMKVEVQSPYNRISISHNRRGHRAFAVFLLSFFIGIRRRAVTGFWCRSPPLHLDFYISKIQIGGRYGEIRTKKGIYQRKRRLCGTVLYGLLPPQGSRPDLSGQAVHPYSRLSA